MLSGTHRSWSGVGHVEAQSGDIIMVNPDEMHDGMPVRGNPREWQMLYFDPTAVARMAGAEGANTFEVVGPAVHADLDDALCSIFCLRDRSVT